MFTKEPKSFSVSVIGEKTGQQWTGDFSVKTMLSHRDELRRDAIRRELLGPTNPQAADSFTVDATQVFADLSVRILKAPTWWTESGGGLDMHDANVVSEIYKQALAAEQDALNRIKNEAEKAKEELRKSE